MLLLGICGRVQRTKISPLNKISMTQKHYPYYNDIYIITKIGYISLDDVEDIFEGAAI